MLTRTPLNGPVNPGWDDRPHAIVIGAGFGGLAAAVRLGARGYRVTVVEALDQPGGRAGAYHQDGFTFDQGPTIITLPHVFEELWALAGRNLLQQQAWQAAYIIPLIDARRMEVFAAVYDAIGNEVMPPHAHILETDSYAAQLAEGPVLFLGSGATKWQSLCRHSHAHFSVTPYHAGHVCSLAEERWQQQQFASLAYTAPLYVKSFYTTTGKA